MIKKHSFWFTFSIVLQFCTGIFHLLSFLNNAHPKNETEKQLFDLMTTYKFDLGSGFLRSMDNLMNSFSIAFSLLLFFSGTLNLFLLKNNLPDKTLRGILFINLVTYLICFITMCILTFLPPIICTGLIVVTLLISYFILYNKKIN